MSQHTIVVTQAFSKQGLGAVYSLLGTKQFKVRALTSRQNTIEGDHLLEKYGDLVEIVVVKNGGTDKDDLVKAFTGAHGVFLISPSVSYEDPNFSELEYNNVKSISDIAVQCNVKHIIFSTLDKPTSEAAIQEFQDYLHFVPRAKAEDYIRSLPVHSTFIAPAYFYSNFIEYYQPNVETLPNGDKLFVFSLPGIPGDTKFPYIDATISPGVAVRDLFLEYIKQGESKTENGKHYQLFSEYLTGNEIAAIFERVTGQKAVYKPIEVQNYLEMMKNFGLERTGKLLLTIFQYPLKYGYYNPKNPIYHLPNETIGSFEQFLKHCNWKGESFKDFKNTYLKSYGYL